MSQDMKTEARAQQAGFSLLELTVALMVTLIVSGAIFGLLVGGKSAFRREPALSDRQQQIRIAMAMIERDVQLAGQDLGRWIQVFSMGLNNAGPQDSVMTDMPGITDNSDFLEVRGNDGTCPALGICTDPTTGNDLKTFSLFPACFNVPGMVTIVNRRTGESAIRWVCMPGASASGACTGGGNSNGHAVTPPGTAPNGCEAPGQPCNPGGSVVPFNCGTDGVDCDTSAIQMLRYEIRLDAATGVPDLWRSPRGGIAGGASGVCAVPPGTANDWQLVARGIEDMQVEYRTGNTLPGPGGAPGWQNQPDLVLPPPPLPGGAPGVPTPVNWNTIVREVRVTLSARALEPNLTGQTMSTLEPAGEGRVRGRLQRTITPRSAMIVLSQGNQWR